MRDLTKTPLVELIDRLTKLQNQIGFDELEYNDIIKELWSRIPTLKNSPEFQLMKPKTEILDVNINWLGIKNACRTTINKDESELEPTSEWKRKLLICRHSPIRKGEITWKWTGIPSYVATHFSRHGIGCEKWISTNRTDRCGVPREQLSQAKPVNMEMVANLEALQNISERRLCLQADKTTIQYWKSLVDEIKKVDEDVAWSMVPQCVRAGGCTECFGRCKYYETLMKDAPIETQMNLVKRYDYYNSKRGDC